MIEREKEKEKANQNERISPETSFTGLDVREVYLNTFPLHLFDDASFWVNVGVGKEETDDIRKTLKDLKNKAAQTVNYQRVDLAKYDYEIYLVEKPFFNEPTLFIDVIILEKDGGKEMQYIRPFGPYWDQLQTKGFDLNSIPKEELFYPEKSWKYQ